MEMLLPLVKQLESRTGVEMSAVKIVCVILDVRVVRKAA